MTLIEAREKVYYVKDALFVIRFMYVVRNEMIILFVRFL